MAYEALNRIDFPLDHWLNSHFGKHAAFDALIGFVSGNGLVSGALLVSVFWWAWYRHTDPAVRRRDREHVLATLWAGGLAFFLARLLVLVLPFRTRPRLDPVLKFILPANWNAGLVTDWNSFPCDVAMMATALAVGLCFVSRRIGMVVGLYVLAVTCFPLIYLGLHYPTDVLAGLIMGAALGYILNLGVVRMRLAAPLLAWETRSAGSYYASLFLISYEFATQFTSTRAILGGLAHALHRVVGAH
jgi:undecaprenyl-diphosphatase